MSTRKPEGYAPDMFSEHARLAQLGAKVVEILRTYDTEDDCAMAHAYLAVDEAARDLGLLETPEERARRTAPPEGSRYYGTQDGHFDEGGAQ